MTVKFCPHCGAEIATEFKFCPTCGKRLPDEPSADGTHESEESRLREDVLVCPTCGFTNQAGARSCESCGTFLGGAGIKQVEMEPKPPTVRKAEEEGARNEQRARPGKEKKKERSQPSQQKAPASRRFHLETTQIAAIAAAVILGSIFVYGLLSTRSTQSEAGSGGNMPSQQAASSGQPSADVLHEIDRLREVVDKNPGDIGSVLKLANILQDNAFYDQAAVYYKRYLDKVPKNVDARVDYGVTLFEGGHTQDAIAQLEEALKINPEHQIGLYNLGIVYLNAGEFDKANAAFKECVKVNPNSDIGKKAQQTLEQHANITSQEVN